MLPWKEVFQEKLPRLRVINFAKGKELLTIFSQKVIQSVELMCPELKESLKLLEESIEQLEPTLEEHYSEVFDKKVQFVRSSTHKLIAPQIWGFMKKTYQKAAQQKGNSSRPTVTRWTLLTNY